MKSANREVCEQKIKLVLQTSKRKVRGFGEFKLRLIKKNAIINNSTDGMTDDDVSTHYHICDIVSSISFIRSMECDPVSERRTGNCYGRYLYLFISKV